MPTLSGCAFSAKGDGLARIFVRPKFFDMCRNIALLVLGLLFAAIGLGIWYYDRQFFEQPNLQTAEGEVVELLQLRSKKGFRYAPVFQFTATDGKVYRVQSDVSSSRPEYRLGERVVLYYSEGAPYEARVQRKGLLRYLPLVFAGTGMLLVLLYASAAFRKRS